MIPAYGYDAVFAGDGGEEARWPVAVWDEEGWPMVPGGHGRLVRATDRLVGGLPFDRVEPSRAWAEL